MTITENYSQAAPNDDPSGPTPLGRGPVYRGMRRRNRRTGAVEVWVQNQGYLPEGSAASLPAVDQQAMQASRANLDTSRRNVQLAEQFLRANHEPRVSVFDAGGETGGTAALPVPASWGMQSSARQRMEGLHSQMVRANIQPGQAGTMNSIIEQIMAGQQYPSTDVPGDINAERALQIMVDNDEVTSMVDEAEQWAREHRGLQGFDVHWTRNRSRQVRQESEQRHRERFGRRGGQSGGPQPGAVEDGYRFKGGNPGDRNNWERVG